MTINGYLKCPFRIVMQRCSHQLTDSLALRRMGLNPSWLADSAFIWITGYIDPKGHVFVASPTVSSTGNISALSSPAAAP